MNIFTKVFRLFLLVCLMSACQQDDLLEVNVDNTITADVVLGKGSGTKRSVSAASARPELQMIVPTSGIGGTVTQTLASSLAHNVERIDVRIEETEGAIPLQELITLEKIADNGTNARFKATGVDFEEGFIPNLALNAQLTFRDEEGNAINEEPFEAFPTAQRNNGIYLRKLKINCELSGTCVFTLKVKGKNANQVASLQGFVSNEDGDIQDVVFTRTTEGGEEMEHASQENPVFIAQPGAMNNVIATLTAYDTDGNILDSNIELVTLPEIDFGPQVGKLELTRFGNSEFYLAETSIRGTNRPLVTENSITFMQDFSEPEFYDMPRIASNENRDLYWRTFDGIDFNLMEDLGTTMFGLAIEEEEHLLDIKKKQIEVQQAAITPEYTSELSRMQNGNLQYTIMFNEPQDTELLTWVVFNDGSGTEKGRYRMTPATDNNAVWTAKNIKPSETNGITPGETVTALTCRFDRGVQAMVDGRLDSELIVPDNEDTNTITVPRVSLSQNEDGETFTFEAEVTGDAIAAINEVAVFIIPQDGGSDADPADFTLTLVDNTFDGQLYRNSFVTFADPDTVIDMEYLVEFTFSDVAGNQLAYLEASVVGSEHARPSASICMGNGDTPSKFTMTIETDAVEAQQMDILAISFLNNGEPFTLNNSYNMLRTATNENKATFRVEGLEFLDLNQVENGLMVLSSLHTDVPYSSTLSFNAAPLKQYGLGYYNEETGKWECEDECLDIENSGSCGETDHL